MEGAAAAAAAVNIIPTCLVDLRMVALDLDVARLSHIADGLRKGKVGRQADGNGDVVRGAAKVDRDCACQLQEGDRAGVDEAAAVGVEAGELRRRQRQRQKKTTSVTKTTTAAAAAQKGKTMRGCNRAAPIRTLPCA